MFGNKISKIEKAVAKGKGLNLVKFLKDKDESVRLAAIDGIGQLRVNDGTNDLINMLRDPSAQIRSHAASALGAIGDNHAKAHIANAMNGEKDAEVRAVMQEAVYKLRDF